jgi:hypothetical protein
VADGILDKDRLWFLPQVKTQVLLRLLQWKRKKEKAAKISDFMWDKQRKKEGTYWTDITAHSLSQYALTT